MFTGIITDVGEIASLKPVAQGQLHRMRIMCRYDRATIAEYASDPDNGQTLRMLLEERQGRWKPDVRAEIGRRHLAFLRQQAQREHPGMTRRERLFPNAPPITTPTAISTTLPRIANALNSDIMLMAEPSVEPTSGKRRALRPTVNVPGILAPGTENVKREPSLGHRWATR